MAHGDVHLDALEGLEAGADHEDPHDPSQGGTGAEERARQKVGDGQVEPRTDLVQDHLGLAAVGQPDAHGQNHERQESDQAPRDG